MMKIKDLLKMKLMVANGLASLALTFSVLAANSKCMCIYHEIKKPEELKRLRKF